MSHEELQSTSEDFVEIEEASATQKKFPLFKYKKVFQQDQKKILKTK